MDDEQALRRHLSAEVHSLARMGLGTSDSVILYSSETADGHACAQAVATYLRAQRPGLVCNIEVIQGLQVNDAARFRSEGVINFTKAVLRAIEANGPRQCVLNPTGGFKSLVPYTVLIGMIKGVTAKYIFEQSSALIPLPAVPIELPRERLEPLRPLIERIQLETAVSRSALEDALPYHERQALEPLFEEVGDGQVTLSPFGFLVREALERPSALVPYLSRRAIEDLVRMRRIQDTKPESYLRRVAASEQQLQVGSHIKWPGDLYWLKPGEHTRDRYLVSREGWRLLVWRIAEKPEYEELLQRQQTGDVAKRILEDRRDRYEPFVRFDLYERA